MVVYQNHKMNNRHVAAIKDWFVISWQSLFVLGLFISYSGIIRRLASSTGSNPNFRGTIKAVPKLLLCMFPKIVSKLFTFTDLFICGFAKFLLSPSYVCSTVLGVGDTNIKETQTSASKAYHSMMSKLNFPQEQDYLCLLVSQANQQKPV